MHIDKHRNAEEDLAYLWNKDREAWAAVMVALETIQADPNALQKLQIHATTKIGDQLLNLKRWINADDRNIWRFRILDTPATSYRVFYARHNETQQYCILAIVHKDEINYDDSTSQFSTRLFESWAELNG